MIRKRLFMVWALALMALSAASQTPSPWAQPAEQLAGQIAEILGPGQARLVIRNQSSLATAEIPSIRKLLEQSLKAHGVSASGAEAANTIRVTLSANERASLWVAEIVQGSETRVAMVELPQASTAPAAKPEQIVLRKKTYLSKGELSWRRNFPSSDPILFANGSENLPVVLRPNEVSLFGMSMAGWQENSVLQVAPSTAQRRDPRGLLVASVSGTSFTVYLPGNECQGTEASSTDSSVSARDTWYLECHSSDDPWPLLTADSPAGPIQLKAFYNAARNYFTGVVTPGVGVDLPPFYSAAYVPRATGPALLAGGIDGRVLLAEGGALKPVSGARDWGSDFAALHSGCGAGAQIVASGSGEALADSLRAYELPALEAVPVSAPLAMEGTVTALWTAPDGKSLLAVVRTADNQYEVDRVTALCN